MMFSLVLQCSLFVKVLFFELFFGLVLFAHGFWQLSRIRSMNGNQYVLHLEIVEILFKRE